MSTHCKAATRLHCVGVPLLVAGALAIETPFASADPIVDQSALANPCCLAFGLAVIPTQSVSQTVTAGVSGVLTSVEVSIFRDPGTTGALVFHLLRDPRDFGTSLFSTIIPLDMLPIGSGQLVSADVSAAQFVLGAGDELAIGLSRPFGAQNRPWVIWNTADYAGGTAFSTLAGAQSIDVAFRTHVNPVPEPATFTLIGIGLALTGWRARLVRHR